MHAGLSVGRYFLTKNNHELNYYMNRTALLLLLVSISVVCTGKDFTDAALASNHRFVIDRGAEIHIYSVPTLRPVARTAMDMFADDVHAVLGCSVSQVDAETDADIVVRRDAAMPPEGFRLDVSGGRLYVTGADGHGMAYGLLEVSALMGVSPWEYWADCTPLPLPSFALDEGFHDEQHPAVAYRGIFINDEDWGLNPWATRQEPEAWTVRTGSIKGAVGPKVNERIFRLMLRLRANYYWPAMHECSQPFFTIKGNREMAERYGIYVGGSHCEPMGTSPAAEWALRGNGEYNYISNREAVLDFWRERLDEVGGQEMVYTIGMRGVHDGSMQGVRTKEDKLKYLQQVIDDQRDLLRTVTPDVSRLPQVFVPYKEVLDIYKSGLRVPDDVTLMWTDDNYGYIRHFPDSTERKRSGGNGIYYHVSYWGRPHDYLWLNSLSPDLLQDQMLEAYDRGIRRMWMLNVGDIKPSEYQIELFMRLAWQGNKAEHPLTDFVVREFGRKHSETICKVLSEYFRLSYEMKPEHMAGTRIEEADRAYWNKIRPIPGDWTKARIQQRVSDYQKISDKAESLFADMPANRKDAFFQLVKYPVQCAAQMNFKFLDPGRCIQAYDSIMSLTHYYNKVCAGGKWDGIMDAAPRSLAVFGRVTPDMLPTYPESAEWQPLDVMRRHGGAVNALLLPGEECQPFCITTPQGTDSVTVRVDLVPNHPYVGNRLAFALIVDGHRTGDIEFQTYDRSEEWKQNVLRGYATRTVKLPLNPDKRRHTLLFVPTTQGTRLYNSHSIYATLDVNGEK